MGWILVIVPLALAVFLIGMMLNSAFDTIACRISPKYAAAMKVKEELNYNRKEQKRRQREADKATRMHMWAKEHPDNPIADAYLKLEAGSSPSSSTEEEDVDLLDELRRRQKEKDDQKKRVEAYKLAEELQVARLLDWAIDNPVSPEARRHLEEQMEAAEERLKDADREVRHCEAMMERRREDDPEVVVYAQRASEAQTKKDAEKELVNRIQKALESSLLETEQQ